MVDLLSQATRDLERAAQDLERAARLYVKLSADLARGALLLAGVREPEKYRNSADLVKAGLLVPQLVVRGATLEIELAGAIVFRFVAPTDKKAR